MCNVCRIKFPNEIVSSTLENHLHTHSEASRVQTMRARISVTFAKKKGRYQSLRVHKLIHIINTKPYEYLICSKSFPKLSSFRIHVRRFECDICKRHFQLKGHSKNILSHNRIKPCKYCNKRYKRPWSLKMHKYWHTRLKRFKRDFCKIREGTVCKSHSHTLHLARDLKNIPDLVQVFLEPPAAFTSHVSHGVIVFLGDQRATSRHSWNISVVSPIKYSSF
ncbi:HIC2 protein, partial [Acromyrmex heyeri]